MMCRTRTAEPEVGIYVGHGVSHSWTWFADIFEREGYYQVSFLNEKDIENGALKQCDAFFVSGGDTFAIAEGLGKTGSLEIETFVRNGGTYIGACAGAYLPLRSSLSPLNMFNFVHAPITNLSKHLPEPKTKPEKYCTEYGCRYVFHPVREEVIVSFKKTELFDEKKVRVPLYGGPSLLTSDDIQVIAEYDGFSARTEFLIDEDIAHKTMIGNVAAARKRLGDGVFYLFGPHFEHPDYHEANKLLFSVLFNDCPARKRESHNRPEAFPEMAEGSSKKLFRTFLSCLSNARIIALALERTSYTWLIGKKVYDPEKIRTFLETLWGRSNRVYNEGMYEYFQTHETEKLICYLKEILDLLKLIKCDGESPHEQTVSAEKLFLRLREATALFLSIYFSFKCNCLTEEERGLKCTYISRQLQHSIP